jgi:hypothetical protein
VPGIDSTETVVRTGEYTAHGPDVFAEIPPSLPTVPPRRLSILDSQHSRFINNTRGTRQKPMIAARRAATAVVSRFYSPQPQSSPVLPLCPTDSDSAPFTPLARRERPPLARALPRVSTAATSFLWRQIMEAVVAAAAASAAAANFPRRPRNTGADDWKTLQCVTAPKILTMVGQPRRERAPADTSGFVLIKFQVVSVAPDERRPQVEAAARTLHAMGSATPQGPIDTPNLHQSPPYSSHDMPVRPANPRQIEGRHVHRGMKYDGVTFPRSPGGSSSGGSEHRDLHHCHFPGCTKVRFYSSAFPPKLQSSGVHPTCCFSNAMFYSYHSSFAT